MKTLLALSAVTLASAIYAAPASASCADPRAAGTSSGVPSFLAQVASAKSDLQGGASYRSIVGTWHVSYTTEGAPGGEAFIQWHSDGTEWENINHPVLGGNICMGSWKPLDARHVFRNHFGWLFDTTGNVSGFFNETETDELSRDGNAYSGTNELKMYDLSGNQTADLTGSATATRLAP
jgi:hypothetical protein